MKLALPGRGDHRHRLPVPAHHRPRPGASSTAACSRARRRRAARNRSRSPYDASAIDAILLTHAHLDHCGALPVRRQGGLHRAGPRHARRPWSWCASCCSTSGKVQQEQAKTRRAASGEARRRREAAAHQRRGPGARASGAIRRSSRREDPSRSTPSRRPRSPASSFRGVDYGRPVEVAPGVTATLPRRRPHPGLRDHRARRRGGARASRDALVFSGDLGRPGTPILRDPTAILGGADVVVMESTYGGREHEPADEARQLLADAVNVVASGHGVLLVPAFAIGRTQEIVWELDRLVSAGRIPRIPLYLDSPMASTASDIYRALPRHVRRGDVPAARGRRDAAGLPGPGRRPGRRASRESIVHKPRPMMIVASSGMLTGGRVVNHLRELIDDPGALLLFVGYQGEGTLGAHLQAGARTMRLDGEERAVRCQIRSISGFSRARGRVRAARLGAPLRGGAPPAAASCSSSTATRRPRTRWSRGCGRWAWTRIGRPGARRSSSVSHQPRPARGHRARDGRG